ncbi:MAG: RHS repeat-associated core domain-containing protein [Chloroherpetonaceae bacterium]|nr:RHS repeat-associated core domain-containing protein [Chloroherpetonaceae bacterium]
MYFYVFSLHSGQENEGDGKLWNFRARLYNTDFNRFYALDPADQQFSPYAFCGNSPLMVVDKNGRVAELIVWGTPTIITALKSVFSVSMAVNALWLAKIAFYPTIQPLPLNTTIPNANGTTNSELFGRKINIIDGDDIAPEVKYKGELEITDAPTPTSFKEAFAGKKALGDALNALQGTSTLQGFSSPQDPEYLQYVKNIDIFEEVAATAISAGLDPLLLAGSSASLIGGARLFPSVTRSVEKAIVIGEGMYRVKPAARSIGAKWYQAWTKNFPRDRLMTEAELIAAKSRNARWLKSKISQGYKIYDIGPKGTNITSPFYQLEKDIIEELGYPTIKLLGY